MKFFSLFKSIYKKQNYILAIIVILLSLDLILFLRVNWAFLMWNIFLAVIAAQLINKYSSIDFDKTKLSSFKKAIYRVICLVLFPNIIYLITDIIHIRYFLESYIPNYPQIYSTTSIGLGNKIIILEISILILTCIYGLMLHIKTMPKLKNMFNANTRNRKYILILIISYALFIGRISRLNSWDIVTNPTLFLKTVISSLIDPDMYAFTLLFFCLLLVIDNLANRLNKSNNY